MQYAWLDFSQERGRSLLISIPEYLERNWSDEDLAWGELEMDGWNICGPFPGETLHDHLLNRVVH